MLSRISRSVTTGYWRAAIFNRSQSTKVEKKKNKETDSKNNGPEKKDMRVTVVGASGKVGSTLSLLLKQSPWIDTLAMCDIEKRNCGIAMDISHIDTNCRLYAYTGCDQISEALLDSKIVLVCAGEPRSPGLSMEELFECNACNIIRITERFATCCPNAFLGIITQPVNSLVPMVSEVLKKAGKYDHKKVFGLSCVNVVRATTFVAEALRMDPSGIIVPVVGGHSEKTIVPILSQTKPCTKIAGPDYCEIIRLVKKSANWVYELKDNKETAILAPAYAAARFTNNLLRAIDGQTGVFDCAYVHTSAVPGSSYFTIPIELGPQGIKAARLPKMCNYETRIMQDAICELAPEISRGEKFVCEEATKRSKEKDAKNK